MRKMRNEAGFNLIEAAIVLGIVGLVVGGIWAAASAAYENMRLQSASKNLLALAQSIKAHYSGSGSTGVVSVAELLNIGLVPKDMIVGSTIKSAWGRDVTVTNGATSGTFNITYTNLTESSCRNLLARNYAVGNGVITSMAVDSTLVTNTTFNCPDNDNGVTFTFKIQG